MTTFKKQLLFIIIGTLIIISGVLTILAYGNRGNAPVAWWKFDEGYGQIVYDAAGANDGAITNALWRNEPDCKSGKCLWFDGSNTNYVNMGNIFNDSTIQNTMTVEVWFKTHTLSQPDENVAVLVSKRQFSVDNSAWALRLSSSGVSWIIYDDGANGYVSSATLTSADLNQWHHLVGTWSSGSQMLYLDGKLVDSDSRGFSKINDSTSNVYIGLDDNTVNDWFLGFIDDVRIYNYARSASQIKADYLAGAGGKGGSIKVSSKDEVRNAGEGLIGHWKMDESSGNALDSSGSSLTLTNNNTTPFVAGKYGNAADFTPASSQYFSTATSVSSVKTVEFWVYPDSNTNNYFDLASGVYVTSSSGTLTATGFTSAVIYVNGIQSSAITASAWSHIAVVTNTGITASAIAFGKANSSYFDGKLDDIKLYNTARSATQIMLDYETGPPPVAHWRMDEKVSGDAKTIYDTSGTNNGTTVDGANNTGMNCAKAGKYGSACEFDGTDDYVNVNQSFVAAGQGEYTASAWFKWAGGGGGVDGRRFIMEVNPNYALSITLVAGDNPVIRSWKYDGTDSYITGTTIVQPNIWYFVTVTYKRDTTNGHQLYVNGKLEAQQNTAGDLKAATSLKIGTYRGADNRWFSGLIDDVRIYNYARTQKQIYEDMNAGHPMGGSPVGSQYVYLNLDEGYGSTAYNRGSTKDIDAVLCNSPSWTLNGYFGKAINFDGTNDYLTLSDNTLFDYTGEDITFSAWFYSDSTESDGGCIFSKPWNGGGEYNYRLDWGSNNKLTLYLNGTGAEQNISNNNTLADETWYHVAITIDSVSKMRTFYINGIKDASSAHTISAWTPDIAETNLPLILGTLYAYNCSSWEGNTAHAFDGRIDEFKIYKGVMSPAEIKQEYNRGASMVLGSERNSASTWDDGGFGGAAPVAIWKMDEKTGQYAWDVSPNENTGTLGSTSGSDVNDPTWKAADSCKQGGCLSFDGTDDYVNCGNDSSLDIQNAITIEAWVKIGAKTTEQLIVSKGFYGEPYAYTLYIRPAVSVIRFYINSTLYFAQATVNMVAGQWYHITGTYDKQNIRIFVNGIEGTPLAFTTPINSNNLNVTIGRGPTTIDYFFSGTIDEVRTYNYARTVAQIAWDYNRGKPKLHWKFDENTGATAYDYYKTKNGVITGPDWTGAADQCKFNYCLDFIPANSDYVDVGNTGIGTNLYAVSFWIYPDSVISQSIIDFDGGTHKITTDASGNLTATGWSSPTYYVNGKAGGATPPLQAGQWQHIVITTATAFSPSDVDFGRVATNYFDGRLDEIKFYTYPLTASQVKQDYNEGAAVRFGPNEGLP